MFQIFSLPNLKAVGKFKLASRDGCKIRKAGVISFRSKSGAYTTLDLSTFYRKIARSFSAIFASLSICFANFYEVKYFILHTRM